MESNLSLLSLYYVEACNELAVPISTSLLLQAKQLLLKECLSGGELSATLYSIWPAPHWNLGPTARFDSELQFLSKKKSFAVVKLTATKRTELVQPYMMSRNAKLRLSATTIHHHDLFENGF